MVVSPGITQRRASPTIDRIQIDPFCDQVFDYVRLPLRGGQMQRRTPIVIRAVKVYAAGRQLLRLAQIALARRPTEVDDAFDARLILLQPRVALVVQLPRQPVVDVEVLAVYQLLAELDPAHRIAQIVQPRRPDAGAHHLGHDQHQRARHATFSGQPDGEREFTGEVIHPARRHKRHGGHSQRICVQFD